MLQRLPALLLVILFPILAYSQLSIYVSPAGNNRFDGTPTKPLADLQTALKN